MNREPPPWTLESLIELEQALATPPPLTAELSRAVSAASRGLAGAAARRKGLRVWLAESGGNSAGRNFSNALGMLGLGICSLTFLAGITAVLGLLDREKGGINTVLFIAILLGGQWLILLGALVAWLLRRRAAEGFSGVQAIFGRLARKFAGKSADGWWHRLMAGGGASRAALLWRLARLTQAAGVCFNLGILSGLTGLLLAKHIGFFWETTTDLVMRELIGNGVKFLSLPWASGWPAGVPSAATIAGTRWLPTQSGGLPPGPSAWWEFLLLAIFFWGLLPRAILWLLAWNAGRRALARLDFQGRSQRALWRELTGAGRSEEDEKPLDGVLVLDVGGSGLTREMLRPFLLQKLRVHPAAWHPVAVMDTGADEDVARALAAAPAGVVLLAEGWSLSPARMLTLHGKIRRSAGPQAAVKFLIANVAPSGGPAAPSDEERRGWERFVDSLRDPSAEVFAFSGSGQ